MSEQREISVHPIYTVKRILAYAIPHVWRIVLVTCLTASYSAGLTLRLGLIGLLVDGVLMADLGGAKDSIALKTYREVASWVGAEVTITETLPKRDVFVRLVAEGKFEHDEKGDRYKATEGRIVDLWVGPVRAGQRGDGGYDRDFLTLQVSAPRAIEGPIPGADPEALPRWIFENGDVSFSTGEMLGLQERQRYIEAFFVISVILALGIGASSFAKDYFSRKVYLRIAADIREDIFGNLSRQSVAFFDRQKSGDLISRFMNNAGTLQYFLQNVFDNVLEQPFTIIFSLGLAFLVSPLLTLVSLPFIIGLFYPIWRTARRVKKHGRGRLKQLGVVTESVHQLFTGIRIVKAFNMEEEEQKTFARENNKYIRVALKMEKAKLTSRATLEVLYNLGAAVAILGVGYLVVLQSNRLGDFGIFLGALFSIYRPMKRITRMYNNLQESLAGAERVFEILDRTPDVSDAPDAIELQTVREGIEFKNVSFHYDQEGNNLPVLENVCFHARMGEVVGIVGPTGAGKTTLVDLIARFYEPRSGTILIDGIDYRKVTLRSLLDQIAIVGQDPFLFNTTVNENLKYARSGATEEEMMEAARKAYIHDVIMDMPRGYDSGIGERGGNLSGGERQRVTIARAILKDAPILILDEATSALDSQTESVIQDAFKNLMRNRLTFLIAHRLSTITFADRILVIENGRIVESGTHEELLKLKGKYYRSYRLQHSEETAEEEAAETSAS